MKTLFFMVFSTVLLAASCRKEVPVTPPPTPIEKTKPTLLWKTRFSEFSGGNISFEPQVYQSDVIFGCSTCPNMPIQLFSGDNGDKLWEWSDWPIPLSDFGKTEYSFKSGENFVHAYGKQWISLNVKERKVNWTYVKNSTNFFNIRTYGNDEYAYWSDEYDFSNHGKAKKCVIYRSKYDQLLIDTIFDFETSDGYSPQMVGFGFEKLLNGDEVILVKNRSNNPILPWQTASRMDVFAYNITADTMLWYHTGVEVNNWGGILPIRTYQGKAIVPGHNYIHCFDIATGAKLWEYKVNESLTTGDVLIYKQNVLHKDDKNTLTSINISSGNRNWRVNDVGSCKGRVVVYNDKLFYCGGYFRVVNAENGKLIYTSQGEEWDNAGPISMTPALDTVNRRVFINNSSFAIGLQMAEDW